MTKPSHRSILVSAILVAVAAVMSAGIARSAAGSAAAGRKTEFGNVTVLSKGPWGGPIEGPWEFTGGVTITGPEITVTCDTLKVWPGKATTAFQRAEVSGHVVVNASYLASDQSKWKVVGTAEAGSYDGKTGQGALKGKVKFDARNLVTGQKLTVASDTLTYDVKKQQFKFDRSGNEPVEVQWEEAPKPAAPAPAKAGGK